MSAHSRIYLSPPHLSGKEINFLQQAIASNWIAPVGPFVNEFETQLAKVAGTRYAVAVNSGTSAIHLALLAAGVSTGDEVICPTFTFCATANPIVYCGSKPVFVDSESDTWNIDPTLLEEAIDDRIKKTGKAPKAILVVHLYGMPAKITEICSIGKRYNIPVIEDAAEALGSLYDNRQVGSFGYAGILSFNGNKIITTSGGGALLTNDEHVLKSSVYFRQEAKEPLPYYQHEAIGYNYRISNLLAAVGCSQLEVLNDRIERRRANFEFYQQAFAQFPEIKFQPEQTSSKSNRWLTTCIFTDGRRPDDVRVALEKENIESRLLWKPMHLQPVFKDCPAYVSGVAERFFNKGLCFPSGSNLTVPDLDRVVEIIKTCKWN